MIDAKRLDRLAVIGAILSPVTFNVALALAFNALIHMDPTSQKTPAGQHAFAVVMVTWMVLETAVIGLLCYRIKVTTFEKHSKIALISCFVAVVVTILEIKWLLGLPQR